MALKIRLARPIGFHPGTKLVLRVALVAFAAVALVFVVVGSYFYIKYQHIVDERLKQPIFASTAKIFAAPREVRAGQKLSIQLLANELREAGYSTDGASQASQMGTYTHRTARSSTSPMASSSPSPTTRASPSPATNSNRS
jgi:penicillin-binding protein 1B